MTLKKFARLRLGLWIVCMVLWIGAAFLTGLPRYLLTAAGAAVLVVTVVLTSRHWKCPYCGTPIAGWWKGKNSVCAKCGKSWKEEWE
ncbi:MAG: hypothetical protein HFF04_00990 [Oscillospiraceae bacterium]|nr:hypothetical protein [Oscillospiraceae bacterium]